MLYNIVMPRGKSGRIVIEIPAADKAQLYEALDEDNLSLKQWFVRSVRQYLEERGIRVQPSLFPELQEPHSRAR